MVFGERKNKLIKNNNKKQTLVLKNYSLFYFSIDRCSGTNSSQHVTIKPVEKSIKNKSDLIDWPVCPIQIDTLLNAIIYQ